MRKVLLSVSGSFFASTESFSLQFVSLLLLDQRNGMMSFE